MVKVMWDIIKYLNLKVVVWWLIACLVACFFVPSPLFAASLSVNVSKKQVNVSDTLTLTLVLRGYGIERISLPQPFPNSFTVVNKADRPSLSQDASGRPITVRVIEYTLQATAGGRFRLGNISFSHNGETYESNGQEVEVKGDTPPPVKEKPSTSSSPPVIPVNIPLDVRLSAELSKKQVYVGEAVTLSVRVTSTTAIDQIKPVDIPAFVNLWNKELILSKQSTEYKEITIKGLPYATQIIHRFTLSPTTSGKLSIPELTYSMVAGNDPSKSKALTLKTAPLTLEAIPLPEKGKPAEFSGVVGKSKLTVKLKDQATNVGTPTKLIIEVETLANPEIIIPPTNPNTSNSLKLYAPKPVKTQPEEEFATNKAIWETEVIASEAGKFTIPAFTFAYFDPESAKYKTIKSESLSLEVSPAANVALSPSKTTTTPSGFSTVSAISYLAMFLLLIIGIMIGFKLKQSIPLIPATATANEVAAVVTPEQPEPPIAIVPVVSDPTSFAPPGLVTPTAPIPAPVIPAIPVVPEPISSSFAPPSVSTVPTVPTVPVSPEPISSFAPPIPDPPVPVVLAIPAPVVTANDLPVISPPDPIIPAVVTPTPTPLTALTDVPTISSIAPKPIIPIASITPNVISKPAKVSKPSKPSKADKPSKPSKPDKSSKPVSIASNPEPVVPITLAPEPLAPITPTPEVIALPIALVAEPIEPVTEFIPSKPIEPVSIPQPIKSIEPVKSIESVEPSKPSKPIEPVAIPVATISAPIVDTSTSPISPTQPIEPVNPIESLNPTVPLTAVESSTPVAITAPLLSEPVTPKPVEPSKATLPTPSPSPTTPVQPINTLPTAPTTPALFLPKPKPVSTPITPITPTAPVIPTPTLISTVPVTPIEPITKTESIIPKPTPPSIPVIEPVSVVEPVISTPISTIKTTEPISTAIIEAKEEKPLSTPVIAPISTPQREPVKPVVTSKASTPIVPSKTFKADALRLVNTAYGKLHRGDEKAYCMELLKALTLIFENGFRVHASELTREIMLELLNKRGADLNLRDSVIKLYYECEDISSATNQTSHIPNSEKDYVRFVKAKALMERFLILVS